MKKTKWIQSVGLAVIIMVAYLLSATALAADSNMVLIREEQEGPVEGPSHLYSLLEWDRTDAPREKPILIYNRASQFGRWIKFRKTRGCYDVRAQVLIRDSSVKAISTDSKPCTIEKGQWHDPYSGKVNVQDDDVQIDHMVPLKEAYLAGAHAWSQKKRCVYANFMGMQEHLVAVSNFENLSKSDRTPEQYMPPLNEYRCTYLKNWLSVKFIWNLSMSESEASAIRDHIKDQNCDLSQFAIEKRKVQEIRNAAKSLEATCPVVKEVRK